MDVPQSWRVSIPTDLALEAAVSLRRPVQLLGSQVTAGPACRDQNGLEAAGIDGCSSPPNIVGMYPRHISGWKQKKHALFRNLLDIHIHIYIYLFLIHAHMYPKLVCSRNSWISWYVCCSQRQRSTGTWRWSVCGWIPASRCAPWSSARRCGWVKWGG